MLLKYGEHLVHKHTHYFYLFCQNGYGSESASTNMWRLLLCIDMRLGRAQEEIYRKTVQSLDTLPNARSSIAKEMLFLVGYTQSL